MAGYLKRVSVDGQFTVHTTRFDELQTGVAMLGYLGYGESAEWSFRQRMPQKHTDCHCLSEGASLGWRDFIAIANQKIADAQIV